MELTYKSYNEQVNDNLKEIVALNSVEEFKKQNLNDLVESIFEVENSMEVINTLINGRDIDPETDEFEGIFFSYLYTIADTVKAFYKVELSKPFNNEHIKLMVFWSSELKSWILPVFTTDNWEEIPALVKIGDYYKDNEANSL